MTDYYREIVEDELNVKEAVVTDSVEEFTDYTFKPQFRTLGKRFGKNINAVKDVLAALDGASAMAQLADKGEITITLDGQEESIAKADLVIETAQKEGFVSETDRGVTVVLDTHLTKALIEEGFVREIISKVQNMRKDAKFEVTDHIRLYQDANTRIRQIIMDNAEQIKKEILADEIFLGEMKGHAADWVINGEPVTLGVTKVCI